MKTTYLFLFSVALFVVSCGKQIPGPEGPEGPQGSEGIAGQDGATIRSGMSAPTLTNGNVGDFFLDLSSGMLYGPKTAAGWGEPISLKGEQGPTGSEGASFIGGEGAPTERTGKPGDYYFDKVNLAIFGPKTGSGWGNPVSLKTPEQNGVKVLLKYNAKFENLIKEPDFIDHEGNVIPTEVFNSEITFKTDELADYVDKGLVFVYIKRPDTHWTDWGDSASSNWWWGYPLFDEYAGFFLYIREPEIRETGITLYGTLSEWNISGSNYSYPDLNTAEGKQWLSELFVFDIKIVLVPPSSVEYLASIQQHEADCPATLKFLRMQ